MSSSKYCLEAQAERATFEWTIKNFSLLLEDKGTPVISPFFYSKDSKEKWRLEFFPRGRKGNTENYSSLYLTLSSGTLPVKVQYELSLIISGIVIETRTLIHKYDSLNGWGLPNFVERSRLLDTVTDTFTISCKIDKPLESILMSLTDTAMAMTDELSFDKETGRWSEHFAKILAKPKLSDVTIIVRDEKLPVHKIILAARSPVFAAMFENEEKSEKKTKEIMIEKMEPAVVKGMLEFIYTDNVSNFEEISSGLLAAAEKYDLALLRVLCEESLVKRLSNETAVEILVLAYLHHSDRLKKHVMHFMEDHLADIIKSEGYQKMEKYPRLLMEFVDFMGFQKESIKS